MNYDKIQKFVLKDIKDYVAKYFKDSQYSNNMTPLHSHTGTDSPRVTFSDLRFIEEYEIIRAVASGTNTSVTATLGGDFVMPYAGTINLAGATVDTAGTTGDTTIDILKNGTSIFQTKITINSGAKTSRTATTQNVLKSDGSTIFAIGDIFTVDVTTISTTPAKGLSVFLCITR